MKIEKKLSDIPSNTFDIDIQKIKGMVNSKIDSAYSERKSVNMKSKKKILLVAIAAAMAVGITAFAASGIIANWYSSSSSKPEYKSLPTEQQCVKDIGYKPIIIEKFENGYVFEEGSVVRNNLTDENNKSVEKFKSVTFRYIKNGDRVSFSQEKFNSDIKSDGEVIETVDGIDIYYFHYTNKIVPPDYKMTDEDKQAEKNGELVFSYGSSKVEIKEVQSVGWKKDGMNCMLLQIDGKLSADELAQMAAEAIKK